MRPRWLLSDWDLTRFCHLQGVRELRYTGDPLLGYLLYLDGSEGYRRFLLHDNGGELNIEEIGRTNAHFERSLPLPISGPPECTSEAVVHHRLMAFIHDQPIDWTYTDTLTDDDWSAIQKERQPSLGAPVWGSHA